MSNPDKIKSVEDLYQRLHKYIYWLAYDLNRQHSLHILLQPDDLAGELFLEMVSVYRHYQHRKDLDADTLINIVKVSLDNQIRSLIYTYHVTFRKEDARLLSLAQAYPDPHYNEEAISGSGGKGGNWETQKPTDEYIVPDPELLIESNDRLQDFLHSLTVPEREIVDAILHMDERVARQAKLVGTRKAFVYKNGGTVTLNYRLVADALHLDRKECQKLWGKIRHKWRRHEHS